MSMLAERRTKKKWCLNPNGKDWSNDDNKFGQRMLEKMGWKKGCGLGVNLQGMKEHVRLSAKNDTKGLGCKKSSDTEWIHHQQNFENLLAELACTSFEETRQPGPSVKPVSLEEKSKKSRVRVHYQKFTRGKDVSRYSDKDLACIFGKKCSSLDSKSFEMQYSCHINTENTCEADSDGGMIYDDHHPVGKEETSDHCLPSLLPKHRVKDQPVYHSPEDKYMQQKQNDILKEISNVKENSVADIDVVQGLKSKVEYNSASHFWPESVEKVRSKRKSKCVKHSENIQEAHTEAMISTLQEEKSELDNAVEERDGVEKKKKKKNKSNIDDNGKSDKKICKTVKYITSDAEETGNKELEHANVISEADTEGSKDKIKKLCNMYETCISNKHKEHPKLKNRNKKKIYTVSLNVPDELQNIKSQIVSPLPQEKRHRINNSQSSTRFTSETFPSYNEDPHQNDSNSAAKHRKDIKKFHRKNMNIGFRGSNLYSISGYGSL